MVLFHDIVEILDLADLNRLQFLFTPIHDDAPAMTNGVSNDDDSTRRSGALRRPSCSSQNVAARTTVGSPVENSRSMVASCGGLYTYRSMTLRREAEIKPRVATMLGSIRCQLPIHMRAATSSTCGIKRTGNADVSIVSRTSASSSIGESAAISYSFLSAHRTKKSTQPDDDARRSIPFLVVR